MIKEIVEFIDLEGGKLKNIILENRSLAKGLHVIVDKNSFEIKDLFYNDGSEEFIQFVKKYDLKKREYYCQVKDRGEKNFTNNCFDDKYQIHSNSPYAIFFKLKPSSGVFKAENINKRFEDFKIKWFPVTKYFDKLNIYFPNKEEKQWFLLNLKKYKKLLDLEFYRNNGFIQHLQEIKKDEYIQIYIDKNLNIIEKYFDSYMKNKVFAKEIFKQKSLKSSITFEKFMCPITQKKDNLGLSGFLSNFSDKKVFLNHKTRKKPFGGYSLFVSYQVVKNLLLFRDLLKLKVKAGQYERSLFPNPFPIFISNKDAIDNEGNKIYFELLKDIKEPISYKEIIKRVYEKMADNTNEVNDLNFYLIFWSNTKNGIEFYDVDYIDSFQYKLADFEIKNIFYLKDFYEGEIENIFDLEWKFFSKFFYSVKDEMEKNDWLNKRYFYEKVEGSNPQERKSFINRYGNIPLMVATKFYQYNKLIYDVIYKSKLELINGHIFDDITLPIIKEQIKRNDDWQKTYKIKEKLSLYISLYKNFKGEDLATKIIILQEKMQKLLENSDEHISSDEEFAYASGQLIWFILKQNKSETKTHSLLDIFISKHKIDDFKLIIAQHIQKYSHALKFYNEHGWFDKLASEVMGYELEKKSIKELVPLIMAGYFSENIIVKNLQKASESKKQNQGEENGE